MSKKIAGAPGRSGPIAQLLGPKAESAKRGRSTPGGRRARSLGYSGPVMGRSRWMRRIGRLAAAATLAAPLGPSGAAGPEPPAGHRRMVERLEQVRAETLEANPFQGEGRARALRERLAALPSDAPLGERLAARLDLGVAELFLGNEREAIARLSEAERLAAGGGASPALVQRLKFRLALAWLRLGETRNCTLSHTADSCILPIRGDGIHRDPEGSQWAIPYFELVLRQTRPDSGLHLTSRWLLNIAYMTLGRYPDRVPAAYRIPPEAFASDEDFPRFPNVAPKIGLATFSLAGGVVADDFDGDADLDLLVSSSSLSGQLRLFRNEGDGTFADRTAAAGLQGIVGGLNLVQADYDNDGDVDVLVLRGAWFGAAGRHPNSLLQNRGDGTFADVTFAAGLAPADYPTQTGGWADYDNDGDLDLYVGNESSEALAAPGQLFRNQGDGTFREVAREAGVTNDAVAKSVAWGDYDGDRWPDLYVSNLGAANRLYRNRGDGTFEDVAPRLGVDGPRYSFPSWFWDFDNDGALDLFVSSYGLTVADVAAAYVGRPTSVQPMRLYRADGNGGFADVAAARGLGRPSKPMGANFGDLDNDGYPDLYLGTGDTDFTELMPNVMYRNRGGREFGDVTTAGGFGNLQKGHGVVFADLDNDGDQDVFAQMGGAYRGDGYPDSLYENPGFGGRWIGVRTVGVRSNRSGVGARIRVDVSGARGGRSVYKWVNSGGSFGGNPLRQILGLGDAERIDRLEVYWPTSDTTQVFENAPLDATVEVTEGRPELRRIELSPVVLKGRGPAGHAHPPDHASAGGPR